MNRFTSAVRSEPEALREDWVRISVIAGFIATFMMTATITAGYLFADLAGDASGNAFTRWLEALSGNEVVERVGDIFALGMVLNLLIGLVWALVYARFVEPMLTGPGWSQGVIFAMVPFLLSIVLFFPIMGAGVLGMGLDAGPLPVLGNFVAHLVFGFTLGLFFGIQEGSGISDGASEHTAAASSERGSAIGVLAGGIVGAVVGFLVAPGIEDLAGRPVITLAGILTGAAIGALVGSLVGMHVEDDHAGVRRYRP